MYTCQGDLHVGRMAECVMFRRVHFFSCCCKLLWLHMLSWWLTFMGSIIAIIKLICMVTFIINIESIQSIPYWQHSQLSWVFINYIIITSLIVLTILSPKLLHIYIVFCVANHDVCGALYDIEACNLVNLPPFTTIVGCTTYVRYIVIHLTTANVPY